MHIHPKLSSHCKLAVAEAPINKKKNSHAKDSNYLLPSFFFPKSENTDFLFSIFSPNMYYMFGTLCPMLCTGDPAEKRTSPNLTLMKLTF